MSWVACSICAVDGPRDLPRLVRVGIIGAIAAEVDVGTTAHCARLVEQEQRSCDGEDEGAVLADDEALLLKILRALLLVRRPAVRVGQAVDQRGFTSASGADVGVISKRWNERRARKREQLVSEQRQVARSFSHQHGTS